ncbi:MAG: hypothetical protein GXP32_02070 [Kiritimatiellaeota bacterium]|nr:hypothetical protein [Kiritimatiellota bacterium]
MEKSLVLSGLLAISLFASGCATVMFSPEVDAILAKMRKAQDPQGKLASIRSKKVIGECRRNTREKPAESTVLSMKPDMIRIKMINPDGISMEKGFDGETGWCFVTGKPLSILKGKSLKALRFIALLRSPGVCLKDVFKSIELKGEAMASGRKCYEFVCEPKSEFELPPIVYYVDKETYLPVKRIESHRFPDGRILRITIYYNQYSLESGIMFPHNLTSEVNGGLMEVNVKSVEWNVPCSKKDFAAPTEL